MRDMLVDLAPYLFRGKLGGYLTRLSTSGLANVTSGGGQVPAFVVGDIGQLPRLQLPSSQRTSTQPLGPRPRGTGVVGVSARSFERWTWELGVGTWELTQPVQYFDAFRPPEPRPDARRAQCGRDLSGHSSRGTRRAHRRSGERAGGREPRPRRWTSAGRGPTPVLIESVSARPMTAAPGRILDALEQADAGILCVQPQEGELPARMAIVGLVERRRIRYAHMVGVTPQIMREGSAPTIGSSIA